MGLKHILFIIFLLSLCSLGWAEEQSLGVFKQNNCINLIQICSNCTANYISSVIYPNSSIAETNLTMTKSGTEYRRTYCNTSILGTYLVYGFGDLDGVNQTWGYDFKITKYGIRNEDTASGLPLMLFMLFMIIGLFVLGFWKKFTPWEIVNLCLGRGCFVIAIFMMMYTLTLLLNIVTYANLDLLNNEVIFLMTWIGWAGYIAAVYLVIQTLFDILRIKRERRKKKIYEVDN